MPPNRKRRLSFVREADATGRTLEIYQEIKSSLGVPHVNLIFQAYGALPRFLDRMWRHLRPALETREFFLKANRLGAEAYTRMHNYFSIPDLCAHIRQIHFTAGAQHELSDVVELFHYNNPLLLLIAAVELQAFEASPTRAGNGERGADHPLFTEKPIRVTEDAAPAPIRKVYEEMKKNLALPYVNTDYQAFARWPDFLNAYWAALKPALASPLYGESRHALCESATALAGELPNAPQMGSEAMQEEQLSSDEVDSAIRITEEFFDALSGLVLNVALAKIALEGGTRVGSSPKREEKPKPPDGMNEPERAA